jgi:Zn-finger nucleic acid-binding protein
VYPAKGSVTVSQYGHEPPARNALQCPKCNGAMRQYNRNGIDLEQCEQCRGIFLDFGELEHLTQLENRFSQPAQAPPPPQQYPPQQYPPQQYPPQQYQGGYGPEWGRRGDQQYRRGGFGRLFFSS